MSEIGPALPPHLCKQQEGDTQKEDQEDMGVSESPLGSVQEEQEETVGPALPPHLLAKRLRDDGDGNKEAKRRKTTEDASPTRNRKKKRVMGPCVDLLASHDDNDTAADQEEEDVVVGPLPPPAGVSCTHEEDDYLDEDMALQVRMRESMIAKQQKARQQKAKQASSREEWMTQLPSVRSRPPPSDMKHRSFSKNGISEISEEDRKWWSSTAAEREQMEASGRIFGLKASDAPKRLSAHEQSMLDVVEQFNEKHRKQSLVEQHMANQKKQKKDEKPAAFWDRERDLIGKRATAAERDEMIRQAADLKSKFTRGGIGRG